MKVTRSTVVAPVLLLVFALAGQAQQSFTARERLQTARLQAVREARQRFVQERVVLPDHGVYQDYRAVIHVHAEDSNHTRGTREEVLAAAKKTGVRVVLFTDHRGPKPETWHGVRESVLFLAGSEDDDGKLRFPRFGFDRKPLPDGDLKFLCHVEERYDADTTGFAGLEICNRHTDAKLDPSTQGYLQQSAADPEAWEQLIADFRACPDEVFGAGCDYRAEIFAKWDRDLKNRRLTGIGANDAHQNTIVKGVVFDRYETSFRNLCTHILARELTEEEIRAALTNGHCYVSHDWLCDPTGFTFGAVNRLGVFPMGDVAPMIRSTKLVGLTPLPAILKLIHNGKVVAQTNATNLTFTASTPGPYRLEAWLKVAGEERPWIYSNPVYLEEQSILSMQLPNTAQATNVKTVTDIVYTEGKSEDESKHKLDLYLPKGSKGPVFFFVHGGAWRSGDRSLYPPLGRRLAKEGIVTIIPSYRLAPKNPHPAQIEDVTAAFNWTVRHIGEYGGDANRIFVGGHSAGAHLAALLALQPRYLEGYQLSSSAIRGVVALSGVYNLDIGDAQSSVFGTDRQTRRDASPLFHVKGSAPPFLVTFCEWDYPGLPAQARAFHSALREAGVSSELLFTPKENHISEMISLTYDDDRTGETLVKFVRGEE